MSAPSLLTMVRSVPHCGPAKASAASAAAIPSTDARHRGLRRAGAILSSIDGSAIRSMRRER